jgi:hypothetical protein
VQRTIIANASPWFKKALTGGWTESRALRLTFPETDCNIIKHFLYFLMHGETRLPQNNQDNELLPVKLWIFADEHLLPKLQNQVMKHLYHAHNPGSSSWSYPSTNTIAQALSLSTNNSALYKFMMSVLVSGLHDVSERSDGHGSKYFVGYYGSNDILVLEGIPGLMTEILKESLEGVRPKTNRRAISLQELMVKEN